MKQTFPDIARDRPDGAYIAGPKPGQALTVSIGGGDTKADRAGGSIWEAAED